MIETGSYFAPYHHCKTPNINFVIPLHLQKNFRGSIGFRHDEFIMLLIIKSGITKITDKWQRLWILGHISRGVNRAVLVDLSGYGVIEFSVLKLLVEEWVAHWKKQVFKL